MTHFLSKDPFRLSTGTSRGDRSHRRARRQLAAAAMRGCQVNALNSAARQRAKTPGVSFAFFAARARDRQQIRSTTAKVMLKEQRGATAIELAMCLPVLLMLIMGLLQLGTMMFAQSLFRSSIDDVVAKVKGKGTKAEAEGAFCDAFDGTIEMLKCNIKVVPYAIDVRGSIPDDTLGRKMPSTVLYHAHVAGTGVPAFDVGDVRFVRAYMELPVLWAVFTPVITSSDKLLLYTASAFVNEG